MSRAAVWKRRLRPAFVAGELRRVAGKLRRKAKRPERRTVTLPGHGPARGRALVSYLIDPFLLVADEELPHSHTNYWESRQIALTFAELGYDVDVIHWTNFAFVPARRYDVLLDVRLNLERLAPLVGDGCLKIQHIETAHHRFHNAAQLGRLAALEARRGFRIRPQKLLEVNRAIESADVGIALGNEFTIGTYAHAGRPVHRVPISAPCVYDWPADRDLVACRRRWLWFGSGGLVHKGLDLVLEAFAGMPDHHLTVCGPVHMERDFEAAYARELYETPNIDTAGWVDVAGERFREITRNAAAVIYPSCSEGGGGSVITCMHAGLVPVATYEASVDLGNFGVRLDEATVDAVRDAVRRVSALPAERLETMARGAWEHARRHHTREHFARAYREVVAGILRDRGAPGS